MKHRNATFKLFTLIILIISSYATFAAPPASLSYQGHLTDDNGVPVDGTVNITFSLYDVDTGGLALWSDTRSVTVNQGIFSVELGVSPSPFPPGLFEQPLWLGLGVDADPEMSPRRPVTSTAFAFKAADADTLEGSTAASLDQSAHVTDSGNPHNVTAAQVGAADAGMLASHIVDTGNPHNVTAAQTGAASSGDFATHAGNPAAHHLRYSNPEAVNAMGAKNDANPLHHDRFTGNEAVIAMLANDGAGSTLDSDKVDGLEASELIDAAQDEVRTPISTLPFTISQPGSYYLTGNLDGSSGGINIDTDDVTLDLMGFTIDGGGSVADYGIYFGSRNNVTIRNGTVKDFGRAGIYQSSTAARYARVMDMQVLGNGTLGISTSYAGIYLASPGGLIKRCISSENGGIGIYGYANSEIINNIASDNGGHGIYGAHGSIISHNTSYNNSGSYGIYGSSGSSITYNTAYSNQGLYGIYGFHGASITHNTVFANAHWGIGSYYGVQIKENSISLNNSSNTLGEGGVRVYYDNLVVGNTLRNNNQNNIYVYGEDNSIVNNHTTDAPIGIYFRIAGNYYRENTAAGNTTNYSGSIPAGSGDGGGNASF